MKKLLLLLLVGFFSIGAFASIHSPAEEFEKLMGIETDHWIYVKKAEDVAVLERFKNLYEKNRDLDDEQLDEFKIPNVIHFIWLGPKPFPAESVENVRSWIAHHPDWEFKFWTDRQRLPPCAEMEVVYVQDFPFAFLQSCYESSQNYGEKSDVLRFEILYREGGLYVDHDASCLKSFDRLHAVYDFYCGLEAPHPPVVGLNITVGNGVIGARPEHPVIGKVLELIGQKWESIGHRYRGKDGFSRTQLVMQRTYIALTHALDEAVDKEGNADIVFPAAYFFAKKGIPSLYSKHFYANAWADDGKNREFEKTTQRSLSKIKKSSGAIRWVGRGAICVNLIALIGIYFYLMRIKKKPK